VGAPAIQSAAAQRGIVGPAEFEAMDIAITMFMLLALHPSSAQATTIVPVQKTARWNVNTSGESPWVTSVVDGMGATRFRVTLVPLWAVEGGVVAFEIVLTTPEQTAVNLLGERAMDRS
jgi:hypothetical protein